MKKVCLVAASLFFYLITFCQITGNWHGALDVNGTELPLILHITKDSSDKISGTLDSPSQMAYGLKCSAIILRGDSVFIELKAFGAKYAGLLAYGKNKMTGNWLQGGMTLPLNLEKATDSVPVVAFKRPQTPAEPFDYFTEDVAYTNASNTIRFAGTFTRPSHGTTNKKYPVVLLISGSGQQDRDETIFDHKPFAVIADHFTKAGIACLRVDDRGTGHTTGSFANSTTADFAKDVEAGIEYLRGRTDVDKENIGLLGHSEGGMIAPMVASIRSDIKFIVLLAAPGIPILDLMEQQTVDVATTSGIAKDEMEKFRPMYKPLIMAALKEVDSATALKNVVSVFSDWQSKTDSVTVQHTTGVTDKKSLENFAAGMVATTRQPWFRYFIQFNPADYISKVRCAVLALNGEKDVQVAAAPNLEAIRKILVEKKVKTFKVQLLPGLNHLFQHCKSCTIQEYASLEETFSPVALTVMSTWIKDVTSK